MKQNKRWLALLTAVCMIAALLCGCSDKEKTPDDQPQTPAHTTPSGTRLDDLEDIRTAGSYDELYRLLSDARIQQNGGMLEDAPPTEGGSATDGSETNIQVARDDEGDLVKTDGEYLYILGSADLKIVKADPESPALVSTTVVTDATDAEHYETTNALFVSAEDKVVAVVTSAESFAADGDTMAYVDQCHVKLYDVSNPSAPQLLGDVAQDGAYHDARLTDGIVYVVSTENKFVLTEEEESSYLPCIWDGGSAQPLLPEQIYVCPETASSIYSIVSSVEIASAKRVDVCAFTGGSDSVYMDDTGVYLARTVTREATGDPYRQEQYSVVDVERVTQTEIKRLSVAGGALRLEQKAYVDGSICDRYAMDVYAGNLRVATTSDSVKYQTFTDETYGWTNYLMGQSAKGSNVFVLDAELNQIGAVTGFAADESIYSVRFLGDNAYVVSFRQTDPLFTIDMADPTAPKVMAPLEIAGVSDYLQMYGDGLLFGLGLSENLSLQAVMFDVADPQSIRAAAQLELPEQEWSGALYNHQAIVISQADGLIAFPTEGGYLALDWDGGELNVRGEFDFPYFTTGTRGVIVDGTLYLCDPQAVAAVSLDSLAVNVEEFGVG